MRVRLGLFASNPYPKTIPPKRCLFGLFGDISGGTHRQGCRRSPLATRVPGCIRPAPAASARHPRPRPPPRRARVPGRLRAAPASQLAPAPRPRPSSPLRRAARLARRARVTARPHAVKPASPPPRSHPEADPPRRRLPARSGGRSGVQGDGFDAWRWLRRVGLAAPVERTAGSRPQLASPGGGGVPGDRALRSRPPGRRRRPLLWPLHGLWPPS
jgi:hypothetical protein